MTWLNDLLSNLNSLVEHHATAWWIYPLTTLLAILDGILPPIPSESVTITLSAYSAAGHGPHLALLGLAALIGAVIGDNTSYAIGRYSGLTRLRSTRHRKLRSAFLWAEKELERRGGMLIFIGRYIPVGRLAVNVAAGAVRFPWRRFLLIDTIAAVAWAAYAIGIGYFFGHLFEENPLLGSAIGIAVAFVMGWAVDKIVQRAKGAPEPEASADGDAAPRSDADAAHPAVITSRATPVSARTTHDLPNHQE